MLIKRFQKHIVLVVALLFMAPMTAHSETLLKMATTAPMGSSWFKLFKKMSKDVNKKTAGSLKLKVYADGHKGSQKSVIAKLRSGKLHAAVLTAEGLKLILKEAMVLQLPLLFRTSKELDHVREKLRPEFEKKLLARGFKLLSWGDSGFNYLMSVAPITEPAGLKSRKLWVDPGDPAGIRLAALAQASANTAPRGKVMDGLKDGSINTLCTPPLMVIGLQWYTKVKSITDLRFSAGIGAAVISKSAWDGLTAEQKKVLIGVYASWNGKLKAKVRRDNRKSLALLKENGISVVKPTSLQAWKGLAQRVEQQLTGKLFDATLLSRVKKLIKEFRAK